MCNAIKCKTLLFFPGKECDFSHSLIKIVIITVIPAVIDKNSLFCQPKLKIDGF